MHLQSQNYVEAALTLKLHADLHDWDLQSFVGPMEDIGLPQQSQFHRKETLCLLILDYLGNGHSFSIRATAVNTVFQAKVELGRKL
jgi:dedicator of cytokinesis protein 3